MRWPFVLVPLLGAVLAWALLARSQPCDPNDGSIAPSLAPQPAALQPGPPAPPPLEPEPLPVEPVPAEPGPSDPEWATRLLELPSGTGPLAARALIEAVERQGLFSVAGASDADLEALRRVTLPEVDRSVPQPYAALTGWLKEAGFSVELVGRTLVVRQRTDEGWTGR